MSTAPNLTEPVSDAEIEQSIRNLCALDRDQLRGLAIDLAYSLADLLIPGDRPSDALSEDVGRASTQLLDAAIQALDAEACIDWAYYEPKPKAQTPDYQSLTEDGQSDDTGEHFFSSYGTYKPY